MIEMMKGMYLGLLVILVVLVAGGVMVYRSTEPNGDVVPVGEVELEDDSDREDMGAQFLQQQPDSPPPVSGLEEQKEAAGVVGGESVTVSMDDIGYSPTNITISVGTTVTFVNDGQGARWPASDVHPTHEVLPRFDPRRGLATGEEFSFTFDEPGEWNYHDHLKPSVTGTITAE